MQAETYFITAITVVWYEEQQGLLMRRGYVVSIKGKSFIAFTWHTLTTVK